MITTFLRAAGLGLALVGLGGAEAQAQVITEFTTGVSAFSDPTGIVTGPDGNLWFTEQTGNKIGRITTAGVVTEFSTGVSPGSTPTGITAGPDGALWFTELTGNRIGRITTAGTVTEFSSGITPGAVPNLITPGPDGNLWFTELGARIGRITPTGTVTEFGASAGITAGTAPYDITMGPDGNLWFAESGNPPGIGRITTGVVATGTLYFPVTPCRVLDTRGPAGPLGAPALQPAGTSDRSFVVTGTCNIPADAVAISANLTVTLPAASGTLLAYRGDGSRTSASSTSFGIGQTRANNELVQLALNGSGSIKVENTAAGTVEFILDVTGYFR